MTELGLARYDAMCSAIAACHGIDEVKELRSKARALEVYARQAQNTEAERKAAEVRIRAERRAGELLKEMGTQGTRQGRGERKAMSGDTTLAPSGVISKLPTLAEMGITRDQSSKWQQLAAVPAKDFEEAIATTTCTEGIINANLLRNTPMPPVNDDSLWLWGRMLDFEREKFFDKDPQKLVEEMTLLMQEDIERLLPRVYEWLGRMEIISGPKRLNRTA